MSGIGMPESHRDDDVVRQTITTIEDYLALWPSFHAPFSRVAGVRRTPGRLSAERRAASRIELAVSASAMRAARDFDRVCAWCSRTCVDGVWRERALSGDRLLTHGICPDCLARLSPVDASGEAA